MGDQPVGHYRTVSRQLMEQTAAAPQACCAQRLRSTATSGLTAVPSLSISTKRLSRGAAGWRAISSILDTYFNQGGMQLQINVLDADMLRAAKDDPAAYPGIVVRVAGYCAYFNDLQPAVQDEIIERTAHGIG